jgi:hypothetical protein
MFRLEKIAYWLLMLNKLKFFIDFIGNKLNKSPEELNRIEKALI